MDNNTFDEVEALLRAEKQLNNVESQADAILETENKHERQEKFNKEFKEVLDALAKRGASLREVQMELQKRISNYLGREIQVPYEVTEENIQDPQSLGNLDTLEEMSKYYQESYETSLEASKSAKKFGERHFNKKVSGLYLNAYDLASAMFANVNAFYTKYKDLLDAETPEVVTPEEDIPVIPPHEEVPVLPVEEEPKEEPKKPKTETTPPVEEEQPGLLDGIDEKYYGPIFKLINTTVVIGNKYKFNTLDYLEYELQNADIAKMAELGLPVNDPEKAELIKQLCLKFVKESKEIRKDQWLPITSDKKQGEFEGRKHSTQAAIINRNTRLMKKYGISPEVAKEYGLSTSMKDIKKEQAVKKEERELVTSVKGDPKFVEFYENFKAVYKLGSPTHESSEFLYTIHKDLQNETNSFGLTGESLKAAKVLVEKTIIARRNSWKKGKEESKNSIEEVQKDLGL